MIKTFILQSPAIGQALGAASHVPGGVGVSETLLTIGLVRTGMPEEAAFAAVIAYRASTFYLPPIWGFVSFRWLEKNKYL